MRNPALLKFLAAVDHHVLTGAPLTECSGYDAAELAIAVSTARARGFIPQAGERIRLTHAGLRWSEEELAPFADLIATGPERVKS
ncbi:MAG: hypothetical protein AAGE03_04515 [Pseudomonadota bacterium]